MKGKNTIIESKISITSHENNHLVNSRPETVLILVKQGTSERLLKILPSHIALRDSTLTLKITNIVWRMFASQKQCSPTYSQSRVFNVLFQNQVVSIQKLIFR